MAIKNIDSLKRSINLSTAFIFFVIFFVSVTALVIMHHEIINEKSLAEQQKINSAINTYVSNLSEKLSIIASSTEFQDYLRSGEISRKELNSDLLFQLASLNSPSISGMSLLNYRHEIIFSDGITSNNYVTLKLCYLNQLLNTEVGSCRYYWRLYINKDNLIKGLIEIDNSIKYSSTGIPYKISNKSRFGNFNLDEYRLDNLPLKLSNGNDIYFYLYLALISASLLIFGLWSWFQLNRLLNRYIANPLQSIAVNLKENQSLTPGEHIEEIEYLINQINSWKAQTDKIQESRKAIAIAKVVAQFAHDVRSPLAAINMIIPSLENIPVDKSNIIINASNRISDTANRFLEQYKNPFGHSTQLQLNHAKLIGILEIIVSEKRAQYPGHDIQLIPHPHTSDMHAVIDENEFKNIISNLINNSIESCPGKSVVEVHLKNAFINGLIEIKDNGKGIPRYLIPDILNNGRSIGKSAGTGLGLSHARQHIQKWQGKMEIVSNPGKGTAITISIPLSNREWPDTAVSATSA